MGWRDSRTWGPNSSPMQQRILVFVEPGFHPNFMASFQKPNQSTTELSCLSCETMISRMIPSEFTKGKIPPMTRLPSVVTPTTRKSLKLPFSFLLRPSG